MKDLKVSWGSKYRHLSKVVQLRRSAKAKNTKPIKVKQSLIEYMPYTATTSTGTSCTTAVSGSYTIPKKSHRYDLGQIYGVKVEPNVRTNSTMFYSVEFPSKIYKDITNDKLDMDKDLIRKTILQIKQTEDEYKSTCDYRQNEDLADHFYLKSKSTDDHVVYNNWSFVPPPPPPQKRYVK